MYFLFISVVILSTTSKAQEKPTVDTPPQLKSIAARITNGNRAELGKLPFQVGLALVRNDGGISWCGGSLIDPEWVLTAAHCMIDIRMAKVFLGTIHYRYANVTRFVSKENFTIHSGFDDITYKNDIALIKIPPVALSDDIKIIKLPSVLAKSDLNYEGKFAFASGWGQVSDKSPYSPQILQWALFEIMSFDDCLKRHPMIDISSICVSTPNGVSPCFGDSGGPLVSDDDGTLIGVFSFLDLPGCEYGIPTGFARVTMFLDWIYNHTGIKY